MMVSDLIDELKQFNPSAEITLTYSEDITLSYVDKDGQYNKRTTPIVFIEPCDFCHKCFWNDETYCNYYDNDCSGVDDCYQYLEENPNEL